MVESIEISKLRGIREGKLENLSQLVILVGPNGCGKSTILDALLLGCSQNRVAAVKAAVARNTLDSLTTRWFLWRGEVDSTAIIGVNANEGHRTLHVQSHGNTISMTVLEGDLKKTTPKTTYLGGGRPVQVESTGKPEWLTEVRLIDSVSRTPPQDLHRLYTDAVVSGGSGQAQSILSDAIQGIRNIEILTEGDVPVVYVVFDQYRIPARQCGDGCHKLIRLALEMSPRRGGLVLIEEPEVHLHARAIRQGARVILAAVQHGVQVVLSTHSLELIDALVEQASEDILDKLSLYRLALSEGVLKSSRLTGPEVKFARDKIEDDLR